MDFSKLSQSNMIAGGGGIVAFIASILPWYSFDFGFDLPGVDTKRKRMECRLCCLVRVLACTRSWRAYRTQSNGHVRSQSPGYGNRTSRDGGSLALVSSWLYCVGLPKPVTQRSASTLGSSQPQPPLLGPSCQARIPVSAFLQLTTSRALVATMLPAAARLPFKLRSKLRSKYSALNVHSGTPRVYIQRRTKRSGHVGSRPFGRFQVKVW